MYCLPATCMRLNTPIFDSTGQIASYKFSILLRDPKYGATIYKLYLTNSVRISIFMCTINAIFDCSRCVVDAGEACMALKPTASADFQSGISVCWQRERGGG